MKKTKKLIIFGIEDFADIAYEYFQKDSEYEVVAFTVHEKYIEEGTKYNLPVLPFETVENNLPSDVCDMFIAIVYGNLNQIRADMVVSAKEKGYRLATYISSRAFVWDNVEVGENCFIFEDNTVQPFVKIKDNVIMWSGNHIGHHSIIESNNFISSHVVVSGWCHIGRNCFIGVNTTIANNAIIGDECWISHGSTIAGALPDLSMTKAPKSECFPLNKKILFRKLNSISNSRDK